MKFGYARVSTISQSLDTQLEALKKEGCDKIVEEKKSGKDLDRPELNNLLDNLRDGDTLVVYDLSRLSRSISDTIKLIEDFNKRNITLISLKDGYANSGIFSKYIAVMLAIANDIQRTFQREKTVEGILYARANGRVGGRQPISDEKKKMIWDLIKGGTSYTKTAEALKVSRRTVANIVKEFKEKEEKHNNEMDEMLSNIIIPDKYSGMTLADLEKKDNPAKKEIELNIKEEKKTKINNYVHPNQISLDDILEEEDYDVEYDSINFNYGDDDY